MNGQEIDRHGLWVRSDGTLSCEAPLREALGLAAVLRLAATAEELNEGSGLDRLAGRVESLLRTAKADLDALREEFPGDDADAPSPEARGAA